MSPTAAAMQVYPSVVANILEHHARVAATRREPQVVVGILLGQCGERQNVITDSFEICYEQVAQPEGKPRIDEDFFRRRSTLARKDYPELDLLGWYSTTEPHASERETTGTDLALHQQVSAHVRNPIYLKFNPYKREIDSKLTGSMILYKLAVEMDGSGACFRAINSTVVTEQVASALQIPQPAVINRQTGTRGMLQRLAEKFARGTNSKTNAGGVQRYPLGMNSASLSSSCTTPTPSPPSQPGDGGGQLAFTYQSGPNEDPASSPLKERNQTTSSQVPQSSNATDSRQLHMYKLRSRTRPQLAPVAGAPSVSSEQQQPDSNLNATNEYDSSSNGSQCIDPNLILDPDVSRAIARDVPNKMKVKKATLCHNNPDEDYKMTARPRGPCLIVNNIDFDDEIFPTRKGSDEDARRFDDIFQQLGFTVIMRRNQTADQMRNLFKEVAGQCQPEHDALFVLIFTHGSEHGVYGSDGFEVSLERDIISCFDNRNCEALIGKPKVFVFQACRGRALDSGGYGDTFDSIAVPPTLSSQGEAGLRTVSQPPSQANRVPVSWLPSSQPLDGKKPRKHPSRTDMLMVFSCLAGFVSVRNETAGSWLGVALAYFIMTHAHERDLLRILYLVTSDVIQRESANGHIQSIELKLLGWTKNLYFNPGIYL